MSDATLVSAVFGDGMWLKGNLHAHTTRSDGRPEPQEMLAAYAALGHGFYGFGDHDCHGTSWTWAPGVRSSRTPTVRR